MFKLGRRILVLALLLVMPIQGIAAPVSHLLCPSSSAAEPLDMGSEHHHDGSVAAQEHDHEGSSSNDGNNTPAGHLSCHQVSSGIPSITVLTFAGDLPVYHPSSLTSPSLFIPEQPQRPPRA